ncbi:hypothetical protein CR513_12537, partial [Mucuna pruriens]
MHPLGILEDVLVQINELIFLADFYVLDMEDKSSSKGSTLILGRPFLTIARTKIDVHVRTLSMEFGDNMVHFEILVEEAQRETKIDSLDLLFQEIDIKIKDKSDAENLVADHLSRIEGRIDPLPIIDDFPNEQLMHPSHIRIKLRVMLNIKCGTIHIYGNFADIMDRTEQPRRYWILGFIGPPLSRMSTTLLPIMTNAKE